jgi:glycosyltransferase involved in cell wall biosynthesis
MGILLVEPRMGSPRRSVLVVENLDLASPLGCTFPYYLTAKFAESHTVHVICRKRSHRRETASPPDGAEVHAIGTGEVPVVSGLLFVFLSTVYAAVLGARHRFDVVYAFQNDLIQGYTAALTGGSAFAVNLQSVPVRQGRDFAESNETDRRVDQRVTQALFAAYEVLVKWFIRRATHVFSLTEGIRDVTADAYDLDLSDAHVVGMGIDSETFAATGERNSGRKADGGTEPWRIVYVGTVRETRGLDHVIAALADTDFDVELVIAGTGPDDHVASLRRTARERGVADAVSFLGLVPHDEVPALLGDADVAVSPLADIESYRISFPAKLLEYMAAGCLVIATDLPAHRTLVDDGVNGYLYDGDEESFRRTLERCLSGKANHAAIREAARETASDHDWDAVLREHERILFEGRPTEPSAE